MFLEECWGLSAHISMQSLSFGTFVREHDCGCHLRLVLGWHGIFLEPQLCVPFTSFL
jgi:hypothetical protein